MADIIGKTNSLKAKEFWVMVALGVAGLVLSYYGYKQEPTNEILVGIGATLSGVSGLTITSSRTAIKKAIATGQG